MRKGIKRVIISVLAAGSIFTYSGYGFASNVTVNMPKNIYESTNRTTLSSGVVHEKIMKFNSSGWWNINVLRINLQDPYTDVRGLTNPNGLSNRDKTSSLVEKNNALAGINGAFFNYAPVPSSLGVLINDGNVVTATNKNANGSLPGIFIDFLNNAKIDHFNQNIVLRNTSKGYEIIADAVNNLSQESHGITMLNRQWGPESIGNKFHKDLIEVVVDNGYVLDIRVGKEKTSIPENGFILLGRGNKAQELTKFSIGDYIDLDLNKPGIGDIKFALGGGSQVLKDGQLVKPTIPAPGNAPRTGVGVSKDGQEMILVTIDGRVNPYVGVSQEMFAAILRDLGAYNAINLDGGGSTTMAIKPLDEKKTLVVNNPSDGSERLVVNGVGVYSNAPLGELASLKLSTDDSNMFLNTGRKLTVKGYDKHQNPVILDDSKLIFSHEGVEGIFQANTFKATSEGSAKVTVHYEGVETSMDLRVYGRVKDINTSISNISMDINSETSLPAFVGKDSQGHQAKIYSEDINFTTMQDIGHVENGKFYSGPTSLAGVLVAKIDDGSRNIIVKVGSEAKLIEGFENLDKFKFTSYPATVSGSIDLSQDAKEGNHSLALNYDFSNGEGTRAAYLNLVNGENKGLVLAGLPSKLGLWVKGNGSSGWLRATIKDKNGNSHKIDFSKSLDWTGWQYLVANLPNNISHPLILEEIYLAETNNLNKVKDQILLDGLTAYYPPILENTVLPNQSSLKDERNKKSDLKAEGFTFAVAMDPKGLNDLVKYDASSKVRDRVNKHKIAVLLNGLSDDFAKGLKNYARINAFGDYKKNKHKDVFFLYANSEKGGIRESKAEQWNRLIEDLKNTQDGNVVLFLSSPVFGNNGFKDPLEADLLHKILLEARERGKNIFVVHGGSSNKSILKDGIRYIELYTDPLKNPEDIYKLGIVEFVVNGSDLTYEINSVFAKPEVKVKK